MVKKKMKTTYGTVALAMFWLILVSGILLTVPFDIDKPYLSISNLMISNPWASLIRNFHFWSSQFFLIISLIHLYDHYHYKEKIGLKSGLSFRLSLGVLIIFMAMLTGFLLKGDADSQQARQILATLIREIPFFGKSLAFSILGDENDFQLIYVHHIATFTVFITIIMVEHSRRHWPPASNFILSFAAVTVISYFFGAPLHNNINPVVKGPWYFVGFQEVLHWFRRPGWTILFFLGILILIHLTNVGKEKVAYISKRTLFTFTVFYIVLTLTGLFFRGEQWKWINPGDPDYRWSVLNNFRTSRVNFFPEFEQEDIAVASEIMGRKESCIICHTKTFGFTDSHNPETIGCFSCHGGDPFATIKKRAHKNMFNIPGNLINAKKTCGTSQCHPSITERVPASLMSTLSGMISVDRTVFGEQNDPNLLTNVHQLGNSAADEHLKNLCVKCHLGNPKNHYGPVNEKSRGGGCLACHLNYSKEAENALNLSRTKYVRAHPSVSMQVTNNHCFGCHSRSGRISTNYEGWHETTLLPDQMPDSDNYRLVEGRRVFTKKQEDVHHKLGMDCIDCHHSFELMGDGNLYAHEEDQEDVQCSDCHFNDKPMTIKSEELDVESAKIASLRFGNTGKREILTTRKFKRALVNTFLRNDSAFLITKNQKKEFHLSSPSVVCIQDSAHADLSCSSCHSSWAPSCTGCHNKYDHNKAGYNMLSVSNQTGTWVEQRGTFDAKLPALGLRKTDNKREIIPVVPGMILTIDKGSFTKDDNDTVIFRRLFAPAATHTTSAKGRSCKSCHNNPVALGLGEGKLEYFAGNGKGSWDFTPVNEDIVDDNLPADAWTGFLQNRSGMVSTRENVFPFNIEMQKKILNPGACLTCHEEDSEVMIMSLKNFEEVINKRNNKCILPDWDS